MARPRGGEGGNPPQHEPVHDDDRQGDCENPYHDRAEQVLHLSSVGFDQALDQREPAGRRGGIPLAGFAEATWYDHG